MITSDKSDTPHPVDIYVDRQMRRRRIELGLSQTALATKLGISFQAVQKYEAGDIRISASRLYDIAQALAVEPAFFFAGYPDDFVEPLVGGDTFGPGEPVFDERDVLLLVRGYKGIRDRDLRMILLGLIRR